MIKLLKGTYRYILKGTLKYTYRGSPNFRHALIRCVRVVNNNFKNVNGL